MKIKLPLLLLAACFAVSTLLAQDKKEPKKWDVNNPEGNYKDVNFTTNEGTWMNVDISQDILVENCFCGVLWVTGGYLADEQGWQ